MTQPLVRQPSRMEQYLFDLRGYLVLENALNTNELKAMNTYLDELPNLKTGDWYDNVHFHQFSDNNGINLQQIYEAEPFRHLIDHPSWIEYAKLFVGAKGHYDANAGLLFIDENFVSIRKQGEAIGIHSGGHAGTIRTLFSYRNGGFHCGQVNILMALQDIGPGDGATMVIPGSHKSNIAHPAFDDPNIFADSADTIQGAVEVHLKAGDAILFVDALSHGSAARVNQEGERRIAVYRYGVSWGNFRHGYQASEKLLAACTPKQRKIVKPIDLIPKP